MRTLSGRVPFPSRCHRSRSLRRAGTPRAGRPGFSAPPRLRGMACTWDLFRWQRGSTGRRHICSSCSTRLQQQVGRIRGSVLRCNLTQ